MNLDLGADSYFSMLRGYSTEKANQRFEVEVAKSANDGEEPQYQKVGTVVSGEADGFSRLSEENQQNADTYSFANDSYRYIRLTTLSDNTSLNELVLTDTNGNTVKIVSLTSGHDGNGNLMCLCLMNRMDTERQLPLGAALILMKFIMRERLMKLRME